MSKLQEVFDRINESKKEQKELKKMYRDALSHSQEHQMILEEAKTIRDKKKEIESKIKADFNSEFDKMDTLKLDIENDMMLLSDAALTQMMDGKTVEIQDEYDNKYEPIFSVRFKKT
jgi:hypothetical protein